MASKESFLVKEKNVANIGNRVCKEYFPLN